MKGEQQKEAWYRWGTFNEFRFNTEAADRVWLMLLLVPTPRPLQGSEHQPSFRLCSSIRQLIHPQESRGRVFSAMPSPLTPPTTPRDTSSGLAPMGSGTPGAVRTGALESRPQGSSFGGAALPPPPTAYLEGPGCPGAPGTWKGHRKHSRGSTSCAHLAKW